MDAQLSMARITGWAKEVMLETGEMLPMLWVEGENTVAMIHFSGDLGEDSQARSNTLFDVGRTLAKEKDLGKLLRVYFVHEGWALDVPEGKEMDHAPSEDPNRIEVLLVAEYDATVFKTTINISEIVRDEDEELLGLRDMKSGEAESNMIEAFVTGYDTAGRRH